MQYHSPIDVILYNFGWLFAILEYLIILISVSAAVFYLCRGWRQAEPEFDEMRSPSEEPDELYLLVKNVIDNFPPEFRDILNDLEVVISNKDSGLIAGIYRGVPLTRKTTPLFDLSGIGHKPAQMILYKPAIYRLVEEKGYSLPDIINHVIAHEVGHAIGYSDDEIYSLAGRI
jgi:predicted Zn-dependent protease with MMP-like domain